MSKQKRVPEWAAGSGSFVNFVAITLQAGGPEGKQ